MRQTFVQPVNLQVCEEERCLSADEVRRWNRASELIGLLKKSGGWGGVKVEHSCLYPADVSGLVFTVHLAVRLGGGKEERHLFLQHLSHLLSCVSSASSAAIFMVPLVKPPSSSRASLPGTRLWWRRGLGGSERRSEAEQRLLEDAGLLPPVAHALLTLGALV